MRLDEQDELFSALSGINRLRLIQLLDEKELACDDPENCGLDEKCCDVSEIADELGITAPSVSSHLKEMRRVGLIDCIREGRHVYCRLNREKMGELSRFFEDLSGA